MSIRRRDTHRRDLLPLLLLLLVLPGPLSSSPAGAYPADQDLQSETRGRLPVSETVTSPAPRKGPGDRTGLFTMNRVRLFVIAARQGRERVILPPMAGDRPAPVMNEAVDSVIRAVERIRRRYPYDDLHVVSQSQYLLQVYRGTSGGFLYHLVEDPGAVSCSSEEYRGELDAREQEREGELAMDLRVLREEESLFEVSLLLDPGRTLVLGKDMDGGGALFAVLTLDRPGSPRLPTDGGSALVASREGSRESGDGMSGPPPAAASGGETGGTATGAEDDRIYEKWDEAPRLVDYVQPEYPGIARKAGVEGTVTLHLVVDRDGGVEEVQVFRATPRLIFDRSAREAVREWRYEPARVDGRPVRSRISQTLRFVLNDPDGGHD
ncbi:MAG: energy transducer TonB [bacterium]